MIEQVRLKKKYDEILEKYNELNSTYNDVVKEKNQAAKNLKLKDKELESKDITIEDLKQQIELMRKLIFGRKKETISKTIDFDGAEQTSLFDKIEASEEVTEEGKEELKKSVEKVVIQKRKKAKEKKIGIRKDMLDNVEVQVVEYDLNEECTCEICQSELVKVGRKVIREEIEFIPAKLKIVQHVAIASKCKVCGTAEAENPNTNFVMPFVPSALFNGSLASPSLVAEILYNKYYLGVPLYRQEPMWFEKGLVAPRSAMAYWVIKSHEYYFSHMQELIAKELKRENHILHVDETSIQCNKEPNRAASSKSYMWVMVSGETEKIRGAVFNYSSSRSRETAKSFLQGFENVLVTDGYASYKTLEVAKHAECWAHCRRYFYHSIPMTNGKQDTKAAGYKAIADYIDKLFEIEREIALLSEEELLKVRNERSKPILDEFYSWLFDLNTKIKINKKLDEAITYAINQKKELCEFLTDAKIPLTNNLAERAVRPFAVHRKNWLFADSIAGAHANAGLYTIIESAKLNNLNIRGYINYLLEKLPQLDNIKDEEELKEFLPWSTSLPQEIKNFSGQYEDLKI